MWNRDLKIFTVSYSCQWKPRISDDNGHFKEWGPLQREHKVAKVIAPSDHYVKAWVFTEYSYDPEADPKVYSITSTEVDAIINPNHP